MIPGIHSFMPVSYNPPFLRPCTKHNAIRLRTWTRGPVLHAHMKYALCGKRSVDL